jgi:hypothetical protein
MRIEGHQYAGQTKFAGAPHGVADQPDMTAVHAVEDANGDDTAAPSVRDRLKSTPALHRRGG